MLSLLLLIPAVFIIFLLRKDRQVLGAKIACLAATELIAITMIAVTIVTLGVSCFDTCSNQLLSSFLYLAIFLYVFLLIFSPILIFLRKNVRKNTDKH